MKDYILKSIKNHIGGKMKRLIVLVFLLLIAVNAFALKINEFGVTPASNEKIELMNNSGSAIDVAGYKIYYQNVSGSSTSLFSTRTISAGGYSSFTLSADVTPALTLSNAGAIIKILSPSDSLIDSIAYGTMGGAPSPNYNMSCERVDSTGNSALDFNFDNGTSFGAVNVCPIVTLGSGTVFFNELCSDSNGKYIELYNSGVSSVDLSQWIISDGAYYFITTGTSIPGNGYYVLYQSDFPQYFYLDSSDDNIYLSNGSGNRLDQVGITLIPEDSSLAVIPNGSRSVFDGHNQSTSTDFIIYSQTPGTVNPVDEIYSINGDKFDVKVQSLSNVGIMIENPSNLNGTMEILDINGRVLYSTFIKNLVFDTKAGTYFVKTNINGNVSSVKVNVIK